MYASMTNQLYPKHRFKYCVTCSLNEVELCHVAATCLIWHGEECLPKEVVAHPVGNAGSSLLLNVP
jgi:hypothetical protein